MRGEGILFKGGGWGIPFKGGGGGIPFIGGGGGITFKGEVCGMKLKGGGGERIVLNEELFWIFKAGPDYKFISCGGGGGIFDIFDLFEFEFR